MPASNIYLHIIASILAGCCITLSLAPFNMWPLAIIGISVLIAYNHYLPRTQALFLSWCFGLGQFLSGVSWLYISVHDQSNTPAFIAAPLTFLWCAFLALFCVLFSLIYQALNKKTKTHYGIWALLSAPAIWVLIDWLRSWILTGFPWLYIGHAHIDTALAGWVPLGGVFILNFILVFCAGTLVYVVSALYKRTFQTPRILFCIAICALFFISGHFLHALHWTKKDTKTPLSVTLVQANIAQQLKWIPSHKNIILQRYKHAIQSSLTTNQLIILPETALPDYFQNLNHFLAPIEARLKEKNSNLFTGIPYIDLHTQDVYNSIATLGPSASGLYHKRHLVPFGEYIPMQWLRNLIDFFNLPMSNFSAGPSEPEFLYSHGHKIAAFICYEIAYAPLVRQTADQADILLTISNDTWFGRSLAPHQHMQFAQFRALENGRYLIRSTNNGISALVGPDGAIKQRLPQFSAATLSVTVPSYTGQTPYNRLGDWPILLFSTLILSLCLLQQFFYNRLKN